jgi:hypothetical protein
MLLARPVQADAQPFLRRAETRSRRLDCRFVLVRLLSGTR